MPSLEDLQQLLQQPGLRRAVIYMHPDDARALRARLPEGSFPSNMEVAESGLIPKGTVYMSTTPAEPIGTWTLPPPTLQELPEKPRRRAPKPPAPPQKGRWEAVASDESEED